MNQPIPFGKYTLTERLAAGTFAEIFRAVTRTAGGTNLVVVVKRILPEASQNPEFSANFLEEARLASQLVHPNIARVYEWGRHQDSFFIAMEYIEGTNLASLEQSLAEQGARFPPTLGIYVACEVLKGLGHAHTLKDAFGNPLGIVHRGVNPPNIVLSSTGEVKLVDFGLARAAFRVRPTAPGAFASQATYAAPEQLRHQAVDHRADIFSVGVVLYEILTGQKLRSAGDEAGIQGVLAAARQRPPSRVHPDIPVELDEAVFAAMAEEPTLRPQNAEALRERLMGFLQRWDRQADAEALSAFLVDTLSGRARSHQQNARFAFGEATSQWMARGENLEELVKLTPSQKETADGFLQDFGPGAAAAPEPPAPAAPVVSREPAPSDAASAPLMEAPPRGRFSTGETVMAVEASGLGRGRLWKNLAWVLGALALLGLAGYWFATRLTAGAGATAAADAGPAPVEKYAGEIQLKVTPEVAVVLIDGDPYRPDGNPPKLLGVRAGTHRVRLVSPGHLPWEGELTFVADQPGLIEQTLSPRKGKLTLKSDPPGADIFIDNKKVGRTPKTFEGFEAHREHAVVLRAKKYKDLKFKIERTDWPEDVEAPLLLEKKLERAGGAKPPKKPRGR
ncbi:MAG: protein kinase [Myxococcales bacterium]|nr:protein kinase [Myxococcales bacterium]